MGAAATKSFETPKPVLPWKTGISLMLISAVTGVARRSNGTVNRHIMKFVDRKTSPNPNPINGVKSSDVIVDSNRELWFRIFVPSATASTPLPVIIFYHGGGFSFLSPASMIYDVLCRRFARRISAIVISVNYRLSPEHRCPSQYDDGFDVLKFLDENRSVLPEIADVSKCFLAGDSSGGNLAHKVAVRVCREREKFREVRIIGLVSIQPFFGGEERTESEIRLGNVPLVSVAITDWMWKAFLPDGSDRDHESANVSGPNAVDITGMDLPDTLVLVSGFDPLIDRQKRYTDWLKKSGKSVELIEYPTTTHSFFLFPELPESSQLISQVKDFVSKRLSEPL